MIKYIKQVMMLHISIYQLMITLSVEKSCTIINTESIKYSVIQKFTLDLEPIAGLYCLDAYTWDTIRKSIIMLKKERKNLVNSNFYHTRK